MRKCWWLILMLLLMSSFSVFGQETATPTPTVTPSATPTATPEPYAYQTIISPNATPVQGQLTRFDYVVSVGDVMVAFLLLALLVSGWSMFVYFVVSSRGNQA